MVKILESEIIQDEKFRLKKPRCTGGPRYTGARYRGGLLYRFYVGVTREKVWLSILWRKFVAKFSLNQIPSVTKISKKVFSPLNRWLLE